MTVNACLGYLVNKAKAPDVSPPFLACCCAEGDGVPQGAGFPLLCELHAGWCQHGARAAADPD